MFVLSLAPPCGAARADGATGALAGSVRSVNGRPVAGATVEVNGPSRHRTESSADGTFVIRAIAPGTYVVRVAARGYARRSPMTIDVRAGGTANVQLFLVAADAEAERPPAPNSGRAAFPPAANGQGPLQALRGITPSTLVAPTAGAAANVRNIEPTNGPHGLLSLDAGTFGQFGALVENTGSIGRLGYALALARDGSAGEVNQDVFDKRSRSTEFVGSGWHESDSVGKLRYTFGGSGAGYAEISVRDRSAFGDLSAELSAYAGKDRDGSVDPAVTSAGGLPIVRASAGTSVATHDSDYALDARLPLGSPDQTGTTATSLLFHHGTSLVDESVTGPVADTSPYLYDSRDLVDEEVLQLDHRLGSGLLALQYDDRNESLVTYAAPPSVVKTAAGAFAGANGASVRSPAGGGTGSGVDPNVLPGVLTLPLGQTQRTLALRYSDEIVPDLQAIAGGYYSWLTPFGTYFGPRAGLAYAANPLATLRASAGTTYESPQLAGLVVPYPFPIGGGNFIAVGTPGLSPDRATEYGIGIDHSIDAGRDPAILSVDVYRVDLRGTAGPASGVYDGIALSARRSLGPYATLRAAWAVRSQYLASWTGELTDAAILPGEQTAGAPLHEARVVFDAAPPLGAIGGFDVVYEGLYNELNAPPFAVVSAHVGYRLRGLEIRLDGTNLTDVYDRRFTTPGGGVLYGGPNGVVPQSAFPLQGTSFTLSLVRRY